MTQLYDLELEEKTLIFGCCTLFKELNIFGWPPYQPLLPKENPRIVSFLHIEFCKLKECLLVVLDRSLEERST